MAKSFFDVFITSETKLDNSFPGRQFFLGGYHTYFMFDLNENGVSILLYVCEDMQPKATHCHFSYIGNLLR